MEPLKFDELVKSRAHRILKKLALYQSGVDAEYVPNENGISIPPHDQLIGIYQNSVTNIHSNIYITLNGITFYQDGWQHIAYADMITVKVSVASPNEKRLADTLIFHISHGEFIAIQFVSRKADYADVWEVSRFFSRVISDRNRQ